MDKGYDYLVAKMAERNAHPDREEDIDRALWAELGDEGAILASDSAGFTRITRKRGTLHFLSMIQIGVEISHISCTRRRTKGGDANRSEPKGPQRIHR